MNTQKPWTDREDLDSKNYNLVEALSFAAGANPFTGSMSLDEGLTLAVKKEMPVDRGVCEAHDAGDDATNMDTLTFAGQSALDNATAILKYAQKGIAILTVDGRIDSDVNTWDMKQLAALGILFDSKFIDDNGLTYTMDGAVAAWIREDGEEFSINPESGEPVVERHGDVIKGKFDINL